MPRMSTSRTAALTIGNCTSAAPKPTKTITPPDFVACKYFFYIFCHHLLQEPPDGFNSNLQRLMVAITAGYIII